MAGNCLKPSYIETPSASTTVSGTEIPSYITEAGRDVFLEAQNIAAKSPASAFNFTVDGVPSILTEAEYDAAINAGSNVEEYSAVPARTPLYEFIDDQGDAQTSSFQEDERTGMSLIRDNALDYIPYINQANLAMSGLGQGYDSVARTRTEQFETDPETGVEASTGFKTDFDYDELLGPDYRTTEPTGESRESLLGGDFEIGIGTEAQKFLDIYNTAMDPAVQEIQEQAELANRNARLNVGRSGQFGSRLGLMESENLIGAAEASGDLRAQAARDALGFAANRFDADRAARVGVEDLLFDQRGKERAARFDAEAAARSGYETDEAARLSRISAYQSGAQTDIDLNRQVAAGLISSGEARRLADQRKLDIQYADFLDEDEKAREDVNFVLGALAGIPYNTRSRSYQTGSSYQQEPSVLGQALAGAGGLVSAYKMSQN